MQNKDSQRGVETEMLELIGNLIASYSHHSEIYNSIQTDLSHPDLYTEEILEEKRNESMWHYTKMQYLLEERRKAMRLFKDLAKYYDGDLHCILKHSIAGYQFAQEILNTDMDNMEYMELVENASKYMYECASKYLGVDIVTCGRCLLDSLSE